VLRFVETEPAPDTRVDSLVYSQLAV